MSSPQVFARSWLLVALAALVFVSPLLSAPLPSAPLPSAPRAGAPLVAARGAGASVRGEVDFAKLADQYLARHPVAGKSADEVSMGDLVAAHFAPARVGAIDLRFPRSALGDKSVVEDFRDVVQAILQVHAAWLDVVGASGADADKTRADIAELLKWLKGAKLAAGADRTGDFLVCLSGGAERLEQFARVADGFRTGAALGLTPRGSKLQVLVVAPDRLDFLSLAGVMGKLEADSRSMNWNDQLMGWTEFGWNEHQVVALQYPPVKHDPSKLGEGMKMDLREPTGLHQHVAQRCAVQLSWHCFDKLLDPALEMALAQALVVDIYSENNTRSGGASRGNTTDGMTAFIPGGNSNGGALPPTNADSGWRTTFGKDYFVKPLRASQKLGAKLVESKELKLFGFQLVSDDTSKRIAVKAPFFGAAAAGKEPPPPEFMTDYQEFFRAYKTAFAHWLRDKSGKSVKESRERFGELLRKVAEVGSAATFEELVAEVYGSPLSSTDPSAASLERSFIEWLGGSSS